MIKSTQAKSKPLHFPVTIIHNLQIELLMLRRAASTRPRLSIGLLAFAREQNRLIGLMSTIGYYLSSIRFQWGEVTTGVI